MDDRIYYIVLSEIYVIKYLKVHADLNIIPYNKIIFEDMIAKIFHDINNDLLMFFFWNLNPFGNLCSNYVCPPKAFSFPN